MDWKKYQINYGIPWNYDAALGVHLVGGMAEYDGEVKGKGKGKGKVGKCGEVETWLCS
jgi:hypothetical protein